MPNLAQVFRRNHDKSRIGGRSTIRYMRNQRLWRYERKRKKKTIRDIFM